jgi:hypothetical protein
VKKRRALRVTYYREAGEVADVVTAKGFAAEDTFLQADVLAELRDIIDGMYTAAMTEYLKAVQQANLLKKTRKAAKRKTVKKR